MNPRTSPLAATTVSVLIILGLAYAAAHRATTGFETWTTEGARRQALVRAPVRPPGGVMVEGPGFTREPLAGLLRGGALVEFIYTRCETVCLAAGPVFQQAQAAPGAGSIRLLSITVDAPHDDVSTLAAYASRMRADPARWRFARVADASQMKALLDAFGVTVIPDGRGGLEHNAALLAIDEQGRLARAFELDDLEGALRFLQAQ